MHARTAMLFLLAGIVPALTLGAANAAQADCASVQGTAAGQQTSPTTFMSTMTGDLAGMLFGENFQVVKVSGGRTFHFVVDHILLTPQGELDFSAPEGVLSPMAPPVYLADEHNVITGGTGAYAGATGNIDIHGMIDFSTGLFSFAYHGQICTGH
jgi:hypothetical protein